MSSPTWKAYRTEYLAAGRCRQICPHHQVLDLWQAEQTGDSRPEEMSMQATLEAIRAEVMRLSPADRANLLDSLIASLDIKANVEAVCDELADRREHDLETGAAQAIPLDVAVARLEAQFPG